MATDTKARKNKVENVMRKIAAETGNGYMALKDVSDLAGLDPVETAEVIRYELSDLITSEGFTWCSTYQDLMLEVVFNY